MQCCTQPSLTCFYLWPFLVTLPGACRCYKALYKTLCKQIAEVKVSCGDYQRFVSRVNIGVNFLQLGEDKPMLSYIEEWFQEQQEVGCHVTLCFNT
jgi:hypothetical protein